MQHDVTDPDVWHEEPIARRHDRTGFDCGVPDLNDYLRRYARQNHESGSAKTLVAVTAAEPARVLGYYSISPASIEYEDAPHEVTGGLGRYPVPVFRLARLAVARDEQGRGLGRGLLFAAGARAVTAAKDVGGLGLAIDAKDARAAAWYQRFGALPLSRSPLTLILTFQVIADALDIPDD